MIQHPIECRINLVSIGRRGAVVSQRGMRTWVTGDAFKVLIGQERWSGLPSWMKGL